MNIKFYVPFETAKMLKAQGYPQSGSDMYYNPNSELKTQVELIAGYKEDYPTMIKYYIAAPAYCEVIDWLAESKEIYIDVDRTRERVVKIPLWHCYIWNKYQFIGAIITASYPTREQAINAAIIRVLEELL